MRQNGGWMQPPGLSRFPGTLSTRSCMSLLTFLSNTDAVIHITADVVVIFYVFPAFRQTGQRAFVLIGSACLLGMFNTVCDHTIGRYPMASTDYLLYRTLRHLTYYVTVIFDTIGIVLLVQSYLRHFQAKPPGLPVDESATMKSRFCPLFLGALLPLSAALLAADAPTPAVTPAPAAEASARSVLRKAIEPVVSLFAHTADGPNHAWTLRLRLAESNVHPPELNNSTFVVRMLTAPSDKVLFQYPALGTTITICRQGQTTWASPASRLGPLLQKVEATPPTAADHKPLAPLRMPVPEPLFWVGFYLTGLEGPRQPIGRRCVVSRDGRGPARRQRQGLGGELHARVHPPRHGTVRAFRAPARGRS